MPNSQTEAQVNVSDGLRQNSYADSQGHSLGISLVTFVLFELGATRIF
jgi:hypothetical protein